MMQAAHVKIAQRLVGKPDSSGFRHWSALFGWLPDLGGSGHVKFAAVGNVVSRIIQIKRRWSFPDIAAFIKINRAGNRIAAINAEACPFYRRIDITHHGKPLYPNGICLKNRTFAGAFSPDDNLVTVISVDNAHGTDIKIISHRRKILSQGKRTADIHIHVFTIGHTIVIQKIDRVPRIGHPGRLNGTVCTIETAWGGYIIGGNTNRRQINRPVNRTRKTDRRRRRTFLLHQPGQNIFPRQTLGISRRRHNIFILKFRPGRIDVFRYDQIAGTRWRTGFINRISRNFLIGDIIVYQFITVFDHAFAADDLVSFFAGSRPITAASGTPLFLLAAGIRSDRTVWGFNILNIVVRIGVNIAFAALFGF